jgi:hypothetical protein
MNNRSRSFVVAFGLFAFSASASTLGVACKKDPPSRWEQPAEAIGSAQAKKDDAPSKPVVVGGSLNKFFPGEAESGKKRTFTTEKDGYVEAKLEDGGKVIATLSITDTNGAGDAAKFDTATEKLGEFPMRMPTSKQTSVLVAKRFQVKVSSDGMSADDRKAWLQKFDLKGLSSFNPPPAK